MAGESKKLGAVFAVVLLIARVSLGVMTPLYLDSLNPIYTSYAIVQNMTSGHTGGMAPVTIVPDSAPAWQRIDPFFAIWFSMGFDTMLLASIVLFLYLCVPGQITQRELSYPKLGLLTSGSAQAVSALLYQFSTSGTRTAPYLQGALGYFYLPIAFVLRSI